MRIWAIADLHLSISTPKPMDVFGDLWRDHAERIAAQWRKLVADDDLVLIAGDISWALRLPAALPDLQWIDALPGRKVLTKGNHDYWWDYARKQQRQAPSEFPPSLILIEGEAVEAGDWVLCGTRGWVAPDHPNFDPATDQRIYNREVSRLERALDHARRLAGAEKPIGVLLHYPPFLPEGKTTAFADRIAAAGVRFCVYGHLHRRADWVQAVQGLRDGVRYHLTSCDYLDFTPLLIAREDAAGRPGRSDDQMPAV